MTWLAVFTEACTANLRIKLCRRHCQSLISRLGSRFPRLLYDSLVSDACHVGVVARIVVLIVVAGAERYIWAGVVNLLHFYRRLPVREAPKQERLVAIVHWCFLTQCRVWYVLCWYLLLSLITRARLGLALKQRGSVQGLEHRNFRALRGMKIRLLHLHRARGTKERLCVIVVFGDVRVLLRFQASVLRYPFFHHFEFIIIIVYNWSDFVDDCAV